MDAKCIKVAKMLPKLVANQISLSIIYRGFQVHVLQATYLVTITSNMAFKNELSRTQGWCARLCNVYRIS